MVMKVSIAVLLFFSAVTEVVEQVFSVVEGFQYCFELSLGKTHIDLNDRPAPCMALRSESLFAVQSRSESALWNSTIEA